MASLKSEPLIFSCDDPSITGAPKKITLLVNPEALTINWKKVITRTRTKSRIVSFYWGQEPISLGYTGQTGSLIPSREIVAKEASSNANSDINIATGYTEQLNDLAKQQLQLERDIEAYIITNRDATSLQTELDNVNTEIKNLTLQLEAVGKGYSLINGLLTTKNILDAVGDSSHTDIIKKSEKYQRFDQLRKFYEATQNVNILTKLLYRHWVFEGYFESFGFTDDAKSPWNWQYSLTFIILNWQETGLFSTGNELLLVPDETWQG